MNVETICPGCQRKLRVGVEHAGKQARCPMCNAIYTVPDATSVPAPEPEDQWRLQTPEGQEYGPVTKAEMENWISEGRVTEDCKLFCEADRVWRDAGEIYSVLRTVQPSVAVTPWYGGPTDPIQAELDAKAVAYHGRVTNAHRGGTILALAIISWAIGCPVFGILAWVMGSSDLGEMRQGTMDPKGQQLTEAGRVIGMLHTFVTLAVLLVAALLVFIGI